MLASDPLLGPPLPHAHPCTAVDSLLPQRQDKWYPTRSPRPVAPLSLPGVKSFVLTDPRLSHPCFPTPTPIPHPHSADPDLAEWQTQPFAPFLSAPAFLVAAGASAPVPVDRIAARDPAALGASAGLTGWRDPFVVARPSPADPHFYVIIGAGERRAAGTVLLYKSRSIHTGERLHAPMAPEAKGDEAGALPSIAKPDLMHRPQTCRGCPRREAGLTSSLAALLLCCRGRPFHCVTLHPLTWPLSFYCLLLQAGSMLGSSAATPPAACSSALCSSRSHRCPRAWAAARRRRRARGRGRRGPTSCATQQTTAQTVRARDRWGSLPAGCDVHCTRLCARLSAVNV
jgi:hypothetical protein